MSTQKMKGFRLSLELSKFIEKYSKDISLTEGRFIEALLEHFKKLDDKSRKEIIKQYLTKDL